MQEIRTQKLTPVPKLFQGEIWLVLTGLFGFLLAGWCAVWILFNGSFIAPEGSLSDAFSFNAALGMFLLTTAAILPLSGLSSKGRAIFRWSYIILSLYSYSLETIQHFRGINPRFTNAGGPIDVLFGAIFGFVAFLLVLFYLILALQYFRRKTAKARYELILGVRYAMVAVMVSFAGGIWMSMAGGRYTGIDGNIIWLHGFGFHALQAIPLIAWLLENMTVPNRMKLHYIHFAGIIYLVGLLAISCQTFIGRSIFEWSFLPLLACVCLIILVGIVVSILKTKSADMKSGSENKVV